MVSDLERPKRRDFLLLGTGAVVGIGAAFASWPLIAQLAPDASTEKPQTLDFGTLAEGEERILKWRNSDLRMRHRTPENIAAARALDLEPFKDPLARNLNIDANSAALDANRAVSADGKYLLTYTDCTHGFCVTKPDAGRLLNYKTKLDFIGWSCPCCGAKYDTSGRVMNGPAQKNLAVPKLQYLGGTKVLIAPVQAPDLVKL
jgi:ubiquinol-cytochrome c reductase iron-sulfur subunit